MWNLKLDFTYYGWRSGEMKVYSISVRWFYIRLQCARGVQNGERIFSLIPLGSESVRNLCLSIEYY